MLFGVVAAGTDFPQVAFHAYLWFSSLIEWLAGRTKKRRPSGKEYSSSAGRVAPVVKYLCSKSETLNLSPSTTHTHTHKRSKEYSSSMESETDIIPLM
jgi:hypothetical protein